MKEAKWWDLGQHEYSVREQARQKHLQMRDDGHTTRVVVRHRSDGDWFVVQIFCV
jgi:hypothetical protein